MIDVSTLELPAVPPSEVEWEDLLVRIEVMSRALNFVMEGADPSAPPVLRILEDMVLREVWVGDRLERAAGAEAAAPDRLTGEAPGSRRDLAPVDIFNRLRARNFAMVQRRGVDVWNWLVDGEGTPPATVYQLLTHLALCDVRVLNELRGLKREMRAPC